MAEAQLKTLELLLMARGYRWADHGAFTRDLTVKPELNRDYLNQLINLAALIRTAQRVIPKYRVVVIPRDWELNLYVYAAVDRYAGLVIPLADSAKAQEPTEWFGSDPEALEFFKPSLRHIGNEANETAAGLKFNEIDWDRLQLRPRPRTNHDHDHTPQYSL